MRALKDSWNVGLPQTNRRLRAPSPNRAVRAGWFGDSETTTPGREHGASVRGRIPDRSSAGRELAARRREVVQTFLAAAR